MALLVVAVGLLFIVQMIILTISVKGIYRIAILLLYPVFFDNKIPKWEVLLLYVEHSSLLIISAPAGKLLLEEYNISL